MWTDAALLPSKSIISPHHIEQNTWNAYISPLSLSLSRQTADCYWFGSRPVIYSSPYTYAFGLCENPPAPLPVLILLTVGGVVGHGARCHMLLLYMTGLRGVWVSFFVVVFFLFGEFLQLVFVKTAHVQGKTIFPLMRAKITELDDVVVWSEWSLADGEKP